MTNDVGSSTNGPSSDDTQVREQLERILASREFTANEQRRQFLRYVVEETLSGRAARIKGDAIAVTVFERGGDFDSKTDAVVRLEARKLRSELEHYYMSDGTRDSLLITIPKGTYVPLFDTREPAAVSDGESSWWRNPGNALIIIALLALLSGAAYGLYAVLAASDATPTSKLQAAAPDVPVIAILPFKPLGAPPFANRAAAGLSEDVVTDLTRVPGLKVIAYASSSRLPAKSNDLSDFARRLGATHVLRGTLQLVADSFRLNAGLIEVATGEQTWAGRFDYSEPQRLQTQAEIARQISTALSVKLLPGQMQRTASSKWSNRDAEILHQQAQTVLNPPNNPARFDAARALLQGVIKLDPGVSHGFSGLAYLEAIRIWFGHAPLSAEARAIITDQASKALALDAADQRALTALGMLAMLAGDHDQAIRFCRQAVVAQPSSSLAHAHLGIVSAFAGRPAEAVAAGETALALDPVNPRQPYRNMLAIAYFHADQPAKAVAMLRDNLERGGPYGPHMMVYHAASHAALGQAAEERELLRQINKILKVGIGFSVEGCMRRAYHDEARAAPLLAVLEKARALD